MLRSIAHLTLSRLQRRLLIKGHLSLQVLHIMWKLTKNHRVMSRWNLNYGQSCTRNSVGKRSLPLTSICWKLCSTGAQRCFRPQQCCFYFCDEFSTSSLCLLCVFVVVMTILQHAAGLGADSRKNGFWVQWRQVRSATSRLWAPSFRDVEERRSFTATEEAKAACTLAQHSLCPGDNHDEFTTKNTNRVGNSRVLEFNFLRF